MESTTGTGIDSCVKFLEENEFIRLQHMGSGLRYSATQLGMLLLTAKVEENLT